MTLSEHFDKQSINVLDYWDSKTDENGNKLIGKALRDAIEVAKFEGGGVVWFPAGSYDTLR